MASSLPDTFTKRYNCASRGCVVNKLFLLMVLGLSVSGCMSSSVSTDYDPDYDFSSIVALRLVWNQQVEPSPCHQQIQTLITQSLKTSELVLDENADVVLRITCKTEQRADNRGLTVGLATGLGSNNAQIGIGTSMKIPIDPESVDYQSLQLDLIEHQQVLWTASDSARIRVSDGKGLHQAQKKLVEQLLKTFPLITEARQKQSSNQ